jgi:hypothetical protein
MLALAPWWEYQQLGDYGEKAVSACVVSLVNARGLVIMISVRGLGAPVSDDEMSRYQILESMGFAGNLFAANPYYYAIRNQSDDPHRIENFTTRLCSYDAADCAPIQIVDINTTPSAWCYTPEADGSFSDCFFGDESLPVVTTYLCGDNVTSC